LLNEDKNKLDDANINNTAKLPALIHVGCENYTTVAIAFREHRNKCYIQKLIKSKARKLFQF
jgi:hypothetical protein